MEQENNEWISLGCVCMYSNGRGQWDEGELYLKLVQGTKYYAVKYKGTLYRIAPDKDGNVFVFLDKGEYWFKLPNP